MTKLEAGRHLEFIASEILPDGEIKTFPVVGEIVKWHRGGFHGQVVEIDDETQGSLIVKTGQPFGLFHRWLRRINWDGRLFPDQVNEWSAASTHLSQKLARKILPSVCGVYVPEAHGFGLIEGVGYVQVLETDYGRGLRYHHGFDEYRLVMQKRQQISQLGIELRNENWASQTHPDNPFGLDNLTIGDEGRIHLRDQIPGIRHKGTFLGIKLPLLKFQRQIRQEIGSGKITFDHLDAKLAQQALKTDSRFASVDRQVVIGYLGLYNEYRQKLDQELKKNWLDWNLTGLVTLGVINNSPNLYSKVIKMFGLPLKLIAGEGEQMAQELIWGLKKSTPFRFLTSREYRRIILTGISFIEEGFSQGQISREEWLEVKSTVWGKTDRLTHQQKKIINRYIGLWAVFLSSSQLFNSASLVTAALSEVMYPGNHLLAAALFFTVARVLPSAFRYLTVPVFSAITKQNTDILKNLAPIPSVGSVLGVPAQMLSVPGAKDITERIWHLSVRGIIAKLSKLVPWGGWGSDWEATLLRKLAEKQNFLYNHLNIPPFITDDRTESKSSIT